MSCPLVEGQNSRELGVARETTLPSGLLHEPPTLRKRPYFLQWLVGGLRKLERVIVGRTLARIPH